MRRPPPDRLVSFHAVAERLAVSTTSLCALVIAGKIARPVRLADDWKFFESDVDLFLNVLRIRRRIQ